MDDQPNVLTTDQPPTDQPPSDQPEQQQEAKEIPQPDDMPPPGLRPNEILAWAQARGPKAPSNEGETKEE